MGSRIEKLTQEYLGLLAVCLFFPLTSGRNTLPCKYFGWFLVLQIPGNTGQFFLIYFFGRVVFCLILSDFFPPFYSKETFIFSNLLVSTTKGKSYQRYYSEVFLSCASPQSWCITIPQKHAWPRKWQALCRGLP